MSVASYVTELASFLIFAVSSLVLKASGFQTVTDCGRLAACTVYALKLFKPVSTEFPGNLWENDSLRNSTHFK